MKIKIFSSRIWQTCYLLRRESTQHLPNKFENMCIFKISNLLIEQNNHFKNFMYKYIFVKGLKIKRLFSKCYFVFYRHIKPI